MGNVSGRDLGMCIAPAYTEPSSSPDNVNVSSEMAGACEAPTEEETSMVADELVCAESSRKVAVPGLATSAPVPPKPPSAAASPPSSVCEALDASLVSAGFSSTPRAARTIEAAGRIIEKAGLEISYSSEAMVIALAQQKSEAPQTLQLSPEQQQAVGRATRMLKTLVGIEVQLGPLSNSQKGDALGAQIGAVNEVSEGDFAGLQAGVFNSVEGDMNGVQVGPMNQQLAGVVSGVQVGLQNWSDGTHGLQLGALNISQRGVNGVQVGIASLSEGGQQEHGDVDGAQVNLVTSVADEVRGLQLSLLVNATNTLSGVQVGALNHADVRPDQDCLSDMLWGYFPILNICVPAE